MKVECRRRIGQQWETVIYSVGDQLTLQSLDLELPIEELYRGIIVAE